MASQNLPLEEVMALPHQWKYGLFNIQKALSQNDFPKSREAAPLFSTSSIEVVKKTKQVCKNSARILRGISASQKSTLFVLFCIPRPLQKYSLVFVPLNDLP